MAYNKGETAYLARLGDEYGVKLMDYLCQVGVVN
jgi:hypothetical protein